MNERMEFDVIINGKKARTELKNIEEDTKRLEDTTKRSSSVMSESWVTLGLKISAAALASKALIGAYEQQFKAETALGAAMKNNMALVDTNIESWKQYASTIQQWANIGDEVTLKQLAFLNTLGMSDEQMKAIIETAAEVTNGGFMPFDSAVRNLAKSLSGMSGELGELFPQLRELTSEQLKAGEGIAAIAEAVKGQSDAINQSPIGKWDALWNTASDTFEKAGQKILGIIESIGVLDFANHVFEQLGYGMDLLGLRFEYVGAKVQEFWNILTFDTEEANIAQQRANDLTARYNVILQQSKDALAGRKQLIEENSIAINLEADATEKAYQAEMDKIYADELAALGLNELGDELEQTNKLLKESENYYDSAASAVSNYASSIDGLTNSLIGQNGVGTNQVGSYSVAYDLSDPNQAYAHQRSMDPFWSYWDQTPYTMTGYADGGYTGNMSTSSVAGVVHGQEYVVDAQTTKDLGLNGSGGVFKSMDEKLSMLFDMQKSLVKMLRYTKENQDYLERLSQK